MASQVNSYTVNPSLDGDCASNSHLLNEQSVQDCFSAMPLTQQFVCRTVHKHLFAELFQSHTDLEGDENSLVSMEFVKRAHTLKFSLQSMGLSMQDTLYLTIKSPKGP